MKQKISEQSAIATPGARRRILGAAILVAGVVAVGAARAQAAGGELFTIENVAVDATAETAAVAREVALAEGNKRAFQRLVARLVPVDRRADLADFDPARLAALIRDFEVSQEKTSRVRYLARLKIRFNKDAVRTLLRDATIPYAETQSKTLLVLPVLRRAGANLLWDNPNPWREAWSALPPSDGLIPIVSPRGGLQDLSFISAEQAVRGERGRLGAIARRYDAEGALVVVARPTYGVGGIVQSVEIEVRRTNDAQDRNWRNTISAADGETLQNFMNRAARETRSFVQEQWKSENLLRFDEQNEITVTVPLEGLGDWVKLRGRLADIAFVSKSELIALSRRQATVRLKYMGGQEQLRTALAQRDLSLIEGPDSWILRQRSDTKGRNRFGAGNARQ